MWQAGFPVPLLPIPPVFEDSHDLDSPGQSRLHNCVGAYVGFSADFPASRFFFDGGFPNISFFEPTFVAALPEGVCGCAYRRRPRTLPSFPRPFSCYGSSRVRALCEGRFFCGTRDSRSSPFPRHPLVCFSSVTRYEPAVQPSHPRACCSCFYCFPFFSCPMPPNFFFPRLKQTSGIFLITAKRFPIRLLSVPVHFFLFMIKPLGLLCPLLDMPSPRNNSISERTFFAVFSV